MNIGGEQIRYCSDYTLQRALSEIQDEMARREYDKIKEEEATK